MEELKTYRFLAKVVALGSFVLVLLGTYVRVTGAGMACGTGPAPKDWPLCLERVVPPFQPGVMQEYVHRVTAAIITLAVLGMLVWAGKRRTLFPRLWRLTLGLFLLIIVQGLFGALTVWLVLNPWIVTSHLLLGTVFLQVVGLAALEDRSSPGAARPYCAPAWLFTFALLITAQIGLGGYVAASGAALACPDFPLCFGALLPADATLQQIVQMLHRGGAIVLFAGFLLARRHVRTRAEQTADTDAARLRTASHLTGMMLIMVIQAAVGWAAVALKIPPVISVLHVTLAELLLFWTLVLGMRGAGISLLRGAAEHTERESHVGAAFVAARETGS